MELLLVGLSLGLGAGIAPGPLLALVVRATVQDGLGAGIRTSFSPLVTDAPIIALALLATVALPHTALALLGVAGGAFVIYLGVEGLRGGSAPDTAQATEGSARRDILRGAITNVLSPHPWVFWLAVGAPIVAGREPAAVAAFIVGFYTTLIGSKAAIAALIHAGRDRLLRGRGYALVLRATALLLIAMGLLLAVEGLASLA